MVIVRGDAGAGEAGVGKATMRPPDRRRAIVLVLVRYVYDLPSKLAFNMLPNVLPCHFSNPSRSLSELSRSPRVSASSLSHHE